MLFEKNCAVVLTLIFAIVELIEAQDGNGIIFAGGATSAPVVSGCGCYATTSCTSIGATGGFDIRIVTPTCPAGQIYCCPVGAVPTTAPPVPTAAPTTAPPPITAGTCGVRSTIASTLPQGSGQARYGTYPWLAAVLTTANAYVGGGVLVNNRYVVTAAHKVSSYTGNPSSLKVRLGDWDATRVVEPINVQDYGVDRVTLNSNYNSGTLANDVAVLHLSSSVPLPGTSGSIVAACLPPQMTSTYVGQNCWVAGWGKDAFNGNYQSILKEVRVQIVDNNNCQTQLRATRLGSAFNLDSTFLCAGGLASMDACTGDGGSPLVCQGTTGTWTVVGLVAWGIGCGSANVPGVYVNIAQLLPWISSQIAIA